MANYTDISSYLKLYNSDAPTTNTQPEEPEQKDYTDISALLQQYNGASEPSSQPVQRDVDSSIEAYTTEYDVNPTFVRATIGQESRGRADAVSPKNATGIMQVMPATAAAVAKRLGVEYKDELLKDPDFNIRVGTYLLNEGLERYGGDPRFASIYYHAGNAGGKTDKIYQKFLETGTIVVPRTANFFDGHKYTDDYFREVQERAIAIQNEAQLAQQAQQPAQQQEAGVSQGVQTVKQEKKPDGFWGGLGKDITGLSANVVGGVGGAMQMVDKILTKTGEAAAAGTQYSAPYEKGEIVGPVKPEMTPGEKVGTFLSAQSEDMNKDSKRNFKHETIYDAIASGDVAEAGAMAVSGGIRSLPYLLAGMGGIPGLVGIGALTAGQKYEDVKDTDVPEINKILDIAGNTAAEVVFERFTQGLAKPFKEGGQQLLKKVGEDGVRKLASATALQTLKKIGIDLNKEGASELATELTQQLFDTATGVDTETTWGQTLKHGFDAYVMGATMSAPIATAGRLKERAGAKEEVKKEETTKEEAVEQPTNSTTTEAPTTPTQPEQAEPATTTVAPINVGGKHKNLTPQAYAELFKFQPSTIDEKLTPEQLKAVNEVRAANKPVEAAVKEKPSEKPAVSAVKSTTTVEPSQTTPEAVIAEIGATVKEPVATEDTATKQEPVVQAPTTTSVKAPKAATSQGKRVEELFGKELRFKSVSDSEVGDGETIVPHTMYFDDTKRKTTFAVPFGLKDNELAKIIRERQAQYDADEAAKAEPEHPTVTEQTPTTDEDVAQQVTPEQQMAPIVNGGAIESSGTLEKGSSTTADEIESSGGDVLVTKDGLTEEQRKADTQTTDEQDGVVESVPTKTIEIEPPTQLVNPSESDVKAVSQISKKYKNGNVKMEVVPGEKEPMIKVTSPKGNLELYVPMSDAKNVEKRVFDHIRRVGLGESGAQAVEERAVEAEAAKLKARKDKKKMSPLAKEMRILTPKQQAKLSFVESVLNGSVEYDKTNPQHKLAVAKYQDGGGFADLKKVGDKVYLQPNDKAIEIVDNIKYGESKGLLLSGEEATGHAVSETSIAAKKNKNLEEFESAIGATLSNIGYGRTKYDPESPLHRSLTSTTNDHPAYAYPDKKTGILKLTEIGEEFSNAYAEDLTQERKPAEFDVTGETTEEEFQRVVDQVRATVPENVSSEVDIHWSTPDQNVKTEYGEIKAAKRGGAYIKADRKTGRINIVIDRSGNIDETTNRLLHELPGHVGFKLLRAVDKDGFDKKLDSFYRRDKEYVRRLRELYEPEYAEAIRAVAKDEADYNSRMEHNLKQEYFAKRMEKVSKIAADARKQNKSIDQVISEKYRGSAIGDLWNWLKDTVAKLIGKAPKDDEILRFVTSSLDGFKKYGKQKVDGPKTEMQSLPEGETTTKPEKQPSHYDRIEDSKSDLFMKMDEFVRGGGKVTRGLSKEIDKIKDIGDKNWRKVTKVIGTPKVAMSDDYLSMVKEKLHDKMARAEIKKPGTVPAGTAKVIDGIKEVGDDNWVKATGDLKYTPKVKQIDIENARISAEAAKANKEILDNFLKSKRNRKNFEKHTSHKSSKNNNYGETEAKGGGVGGLEASITTPEQLAYQTDGNRSGAITKNIIDPLKAGEEIENESYYERRDYFRDGLKDVDTKKLSRSMNTKADRMLNKIKRTDNKRETKDGIEVKTFYDTDENSFDLTPAEMITIHLTSKMKDGSRALQKDGFVFSEKDTPSKLSTETIGEISKEVESKYKEVADLVNGYFVKFAKDRLDKVTMDIWGRKITTDGAYFPMMRNGSDVDKTLQVLLEAPDEITFESALQGVQKKDKPVEGVPIAKEKSPNAQAPIVIMDVFEAVSRYGGMLDKISGYAKPMREAKAFFGKIESTLNKTYENTRIEFKKLFHDIEVGADKGNWIDQWFNKWVYNPFAIGTLSWNPTTIMAQAASVPLIANEVGINNFMTGLMKTVGSNAHAEINEHSATIRKRIEGGAYREHGDLKRQSESRALKSDRKAYSDFAMLPVSMADKGVVIPIWESVKAEAEGKGYEKNSAEYWSYVGNRAEEVLRRTQQTYSTVDRASANRSNRVVERMMTAFMSQQFKTYSMMKRELPNLFKGKFSDRLTSGAKIFNTIGTQSAIITLISLAKLQLTGSEEDKEKYGSFLATLDNFRRNAISNIPVFEKGINGLIDLAQVVAGQRSISNVGDELKLPGGDLALVAAEWGVQAKKALTGKDKNGVPLDYVEQQENNEKLSKSTLKLSKNFGFLFAQPAEIGRRIIHNASEN